MARKLAIGQEIEKRSKVRQNMLIDYPEDWNEWLGGDEVGTLFVCVCVLRGVGAG